LLASLFALVCDAEEDEEKQLVDVAKGLCEDMHVDPLGDLLGLLLGVAWPALWLLGGIDVGADIVPEYVLSAFWHCIEVAWIAKHKTGILDPMKVAEGVCLCDVGCETTRTPTYCSAVAPAK
jgi:hypothetical protein